MGYSNLWRKLTEDINTAVALPLVELAGTGRLLIENHNAVVQYERDCIDIKMRYGHLLIQGQNLEMTQITKQQLVITGAITVLTIQRGDSV